MRRGCRASRQPILYKSALTACKLCTNSGAEPVCNEIKANYFTTFLNMHFMIMYIRRSVVLLMQSLYEIINITVRYSSRFLKRQKRTSTCKFPGGGERYGTPMTIQVIIKYRKNNKKSKLQNLETFKFFLLLPLFP